MSTINKPDSPTPEPDGTGDSVRIDVFGLADADRVSVVWAVVDAVLYGGTAGGALWLVARYVTPGGGAVALVVAVVVGAGVWRYGPPTVPVRWEAHGDDDA